VVCEWTRRRSRSPAHHARARRAKIPRFCSQQARQGRCHHPDALAVAARVALKAVAPPDPTFSGDIITGFVDLALERAFVYKEHAASEVVPLAGDLLDAGKIARFSMLETLADHDDELMEQLLSDVQPPADKVFDDLAKELRDGLVCPVLMGAANRTNGVLRLMKALRHKR
jgi:translation elongation factor EF-G